MKAGYIQVEVTNPERWLADYVKENPYIAAIQSRIEEAVAKMALEHGRGKPGKPCGGPSAEFCVGKRRGCQVVLMLCYHCGWSVIVRIPTSSRADVYESADNRMPPGERRQAGRIL